MTSALTDDPPTPDVDPEAPYGRRVDGTPKKAPGGRPPNGSKPTGKAGRSSRRRGFLHTSPKPPSKPRAGAKPGAKPADYRPGLEGALAIGTAFLSFVSPLDAGALHLNGEEIIDAVNTTAQERAEIAALCEKLNYIGPYGLILTALAKTGAQVAENHAWLPYAVTSKFGAVPRDQLKAQLEQHLAAMQAEYQPAADPGAGAGAQQGYVDVHLPDMAPV